MSKTFIALEHLVICADDIVSIEEKDEGSIITTDRGKNICYYFIKGITPIEIITRLAQRDHTVTI